MRVGTITAISLTPALGRLQAIPRITAAPCGPNGACDAAQEADASSPRENAQAQRSRDGDTLDLSAAAREADPDKQEARESRPQAALDSQLSEEEQQQVQELKSRDQQVRTHEAAHAAAAGPHANGGPSFTYQLGPDGRSYAIGGEVQIDVSPVEGDPEATIRKMQAVRAAALAPADPSSQDRAVAALASQQQARRRPS